MTRSRHVLTEGDLKKRHRDRRFEALKLLLEARPKGRNGSPTHLISAVQLAAHWKVHPTSAFRVLERLRKFGTVDRSGEGLYAGYSITDKGIGRLEWYEKVRKPRSGR